MEYEKRRLILEYTKSLEKDHIIVCFKGPFLARILALEGEKINLLVNEDPAVNKKVFSIFIELAQNVAYYSEDKSEFDNKLLGKGTFLITESHSHYTLSSANLIKKSWETEVLEKCQLINSLDYEGLRKLKSELRSQPKRSGHSSGNIGLVEIALKSRSPLNAEVSPVDDVLSYLILSVDVFKQNVNETL
jgi:hypothetical protein